MTVIPEGLVKDEVRRNGSTMTVRFLSVRFEGLLQVSDPDRFVGAIRSGIGSAKGFGFGLLSVAPAQ